MGSPVSTSKNLAEVGHDPSPFRVLLITDVNDANSLISQLEACGHALVIETVSDPRSAREALEDRDYAAVITSWPLPSASAGLRAAPRTPPLVGLVTDVVSDEVLVSAQRLGALVARRNPTQLRGLLDRAAHAARARNAQHARNRSRGIDPDDGWPSTLGGIPEA